MSNNDVCPVCGAAAPRDGKSLCPVCFYPFAHTALFSGSKSLEHWRSATAKKKHDLLGRLQKLCAVKDVFSISADGAAFISPHRNEVSLVRGGEVKHMDGIVGYSSAENASRNEVSLLPDTTVCSTGDNALGQCEVGGMKNIRRVLALGDCTYAITSSGSVEVRGHPASPDVADWKNIVQLAGGSYHLVGLTSDRRVLVAGELLNPAVTESIKYWRNVSAVAAAGDATIALTNSGDVLFAGRSNDPRAECRQWHDIIAIAIESMYAVGLTAEGGILLAGECPNQYLDMGRSQSSQWTDIIAIAASRSGIGAVSMDGRLHLAGNIRDIPSLVGTWNKEREIIHSELISAVRL